MIRMRYDTWRPQQVGLITMERIPELLVSGTPLLLKEFSLMIAIAWRKMMCFKHMIC